ncbi:4Fe-4S dicluster domain-containing protein [Aromatoleum evansii]|uniref:4Fe-4S dicluster domain-containing protein n=1 Tax=Aromatoleum petrolei TaxID=76116 RepID=A0ABX1MTU7_9RHOO|nr:4Fe-4S dicluster domain-containing protein [Aromatoleum evansii]NMF90106.1 4Fe-4S dicluster domain-containing protein [Aromatoleum petrolei]NMG27808.1 4Fe-4S dicluster domain-containing protein [Aromatoleum evansii]QTQ34226.1 Iron-sulfur binding domain-containing protein [Aromatoleum petrolei]
MARWGMVFDLRRCIGCNACAVACKQENSLPDGVFFTKTLSEEVGEYPDVTRSYVPTICNHCEDAPCERACPTGATYTRPDGIVMVDRDKCIGCGTCIVACPYDQRTRLEPEMLDKGLFGDGRLTPFEEQGIGRFTVGTVVKCTFCHERVDAGQLPACVATCPTEARIFGDLDDPTSRPRQLILERRGRQPLPEKNTNPRVFYID